jgi:hypothetical protein
LELVEGRAAPVFQPDSIVRRLRPPSTRLVMSATEAEPITARLSPIHKKREATGRSATSVRSLRTLTR